MAKEDNRKKGISQSTEPGIIKNIELESSRKQFKGLVHQHSASPGKAFLNFLISKILYIQQRSKIAMCAPIIFFTEVFTVCPNYYVCPNYFLYE